MRARRRPSLGETSQGEEGADESEGEESEGVLKPDLVQRRAAREEGGREPVADQDRAPGGEEGQKRERREELEDIERLGPGSG